MCRGFCRGFWIENRPILTGVSGRKCPILTGVSGQKRLILTGVYLPRQFNGDRRPRVVTGCRVTS